jgi:photosystem II stability/assembly factor-like uncharacterized protein
MSFANDETGYAIGYTGSIWKTNDGGENWDRLRNLTSLYASMVFNCTFSDVNVGYIAGEHGCILKTEDGGITGTKLRIHQMLIGWEFR